MTNNKIDQIQIISIGVCYLMGTILESVIVSSVLGNESWMAGITGAIGFLPVLLIYIALTKKYPKKNLFQINEAVFGSAVGRIISLCYLVFFISLCAINALEATNFLSYFILPGTPMIAIAALFMTVCVYCVKKGIMPLARISVIFGIICLSGVMFNFLASLTNANFDYLFPMFDHKPLDYIQATHVAVSIPYGESIILLMLIPDFNENVSVKKTYLGVIAFTAFIMIAVHVRETVSLGPLAAFPSLPSYEVVRMINVGDIITRTESLFAMILISLTLFKTLILLYICLTGITQIFRLDSYRHIAIMLSAYIMIYTVSVYGAPSNNIFWGKNVSPFIWSLFVVILPLLTLLFSWVKNLVRGAAGRLRGEVAQ